MAIRRYNPRRQIAVRRVGVAGAVGSLAVRAARQLIKSTRKYKFKSGRTQSRMESRLAPSQSVKDSRSDKRLQQYVGMTPATGNELTRFKKSVGKYPALRPQRLLKLMKSGMNEYILRAQGITNFDTNVGYYALGNRQASDTGVNSLPIHVWDLTSFMNTTNNIVAGRSYGWSDLLTTADLTRTVLPTTNPDGTIESNGYYEVEKSSGGLQFANPNTKNACHEWSDIRINMYSARKRGTTYYIDIVRVKDELAHPIAAATSNRELKQLFRELQSPLIYSNLQQYHSTVMKKVQFVKRFKFYLPGGSADDLDTIGKIKEFKLFLKQGNVYNFAWNVNNTADALPHAQADGQDFTNSWTVENHPYNGSRLMMIIRANAPERRLATTADWNGAGGIAMTPADPLLEPSYDMIIRNKWLLP